MIAIIGAMDVEINYLLENLENKTIHNIANRFFYQGYLNKKEVVIACAGIGKVNAGITTALILSKFDVEYVINVGVAGGISPIKSLDLVISKSLLYSDFDTSALGDEPLYVTGFKSVLFEASEKLITDVEKIAIKHNISYKIGNIATADKFVTSKNDISLALKYNPLAVEMEGCAIAQACSIFNKPFVVLRTISDVVDSENQPNNYQLALKQAVKIVSEVLMDLLID